MCSLVLTIGYTGSQPEVRFPGKPALREKSVCKRVTGDYSQEQHLTPVRSEGNKMIGHREKLTCSVISVDASADPMGISYR